MLEKGVSIVEQRGTDLLVSCEVSVDDVDGPACQGPGGGGDIEAVPSLVSSKPSDGGAKCAPARGARARGINLRRETEGRARPFGLCWLIIRHVQGSPHQRAIVL
jgi:hypothetical protein